MAPAIRARRVPGLVLAALLPLLTIHTPAGAQATLPAPRGFAPADVGGVVNTWPFTDTKFTTAGERLGDGRAEATVKALADEIAYSARFLPRAPAPLIAAEAAERPPPDTTLWPDAIAADAFARPSARTDAALWSLDGRADRVLHEGNARAMADLASTIERTPATDIAVHWPSPDIVVRTAARGIVGAIEGRLRQRNERTQCNEPTWCPVMEAVEKKAAADAATAPIEEAVANYFFEAARGGSYAASTREQQNERRARAEQRAALGLRATGAAGATPAILPWEMRLLLSGIIGEMRETAHPSPLWPLRIESAAANGLRPARGGLQGFDLEGIAVTRYGVAASGASGVFELAAALTFVDAAARRASYSAIMRFSFEGETLVINSADVAAITPEKPAVHIAFVPAPALDRVERNAGGAALVRSVAGAADRRGIGIPVEHYAFVLVLDRVGPDARFGLRTSETAAGIAGFPGMPTVLDLDGWRVLVERATFALGAAPPFHFKAVYQPTPGATPALLASVSTLLGASAASANTTAAPARAHAPGAFPNRVRP